MYLIRRRPRPTGSGSMALRMARWALHGGARNAEAQCTAIREELMVPEVGVEVSAEVPEDTASPITT